MKIGIFILKKKSKEMNIKELLNSFSLVGLKLFCNLSFIGQKDSVLYTHYTCMSLLISVNCPLE